MDKVLSVQHLSVLDLLDSAEVNRRASILPPSPDDFENILLADAATAMFPRLVPGATLLIDRHYNSLKPYRKGELNMHAVLKNDSCSVRYVELIQNDLILRPHNRSAPIEGIPIADGKSIADYLNRPHLPRRPRSLTNFGKGTAFAGRGKKNRVSKNWEGHEFNSCR